MLYPFTTPCKQPSVTSSPPFQPDRGGISNSESIHLLNMWPLTLMPKFYIILYKCTYGFTQTHLISINPRLALKNLVCSTFLSKPNYQSNQMILHQKPTHQSYSTAKSSTLAFPLFNNMKLSLVSSTTKIIFHFAMPYMKWATSKVQQQLDFTTLYQRNYH